MMHAMIGLALAALGFEQEKGTPPAPSAFVEPQDPDRLPLPAADLKALRESNIYSPYKTRRPVIEKGPKPTPPEKPRPKPPVVTGIILDTVTRAYQVVIEDRNDAKLKLLTEPKFLKAGDQVLVYTIESVEAEKVVVRFGDTTKDLKVGEPLPDAGIKVPEGADLSSNESAEPAASETKAETKKSDSSTTPSTLDDAARKKILEERKMKLGKKRKTDEEN